MSIPIALLLREAPVLTNGVHLLLCCYKVCSIGVDLFVTVTIPCTGCPAVVANLWDVTDRDIDRFCEALLGTWLGRKGAALGPGSAAASSSGDSPGVVTGGLASISSAVSGSRAACKLPQLIGAAPVCYGVPTELLWRRKG